MNVVVANTEEQIQDVFTIRKTVFVEEQQVPLEEEIDEHENDSIHFILYEQNNAVGAGRFRILDGMGKVERICVLKNMRGKGAGRELMLGIEEYAKNQPLSQLKLNAQTYAIPFYEGLGYEVTSDEFLDAGIPHKTMSKHI
ncbi:MULTISPECIES: GNAT family N-acetyltransferase [Bacillaceae]|uniref:GNAT family N-acetyltransferase n=1 Tax=Bacillaceae TaxID=186817 RepID=UPI001C585562|nr:GNAT family N-acetyltransferase [Rossellomorea sp. YZS02]MBW3114169.1 GNAT family N-acetyltransferase [Bacillus sp. MCCB 382]MDX8345728.1 GNAT family N-acetyltransferase [Rossellomorea sp. YZS02]